MRSLRRSFGGDPERRTALARPCPRSLKTRPEIPPVQPQVGAILDLDKFGYAGAPVDAEVGRVSPRPALIDKENSHRLGRNHCAIVAETRKRHEVPLKRTFVLYGYSRDRLEADDLGTPAERDASQVVLHLECDSVRDLRTFPGQYTNSGRNYQMQAPEMIRGRFRNDSRISDH